MMQSIDTTTLLSKNLTDFLEEIRLDLMQSKYNLKLADMLVITDRDILDFVKRLTNNFDLENIKIVYKDICKWEKTLHNKETLPYNVEYIKKMLIDLSYKQAYNEAVTILKSNQNFRKDYIERMQILNFHIENPIVSAIIDGYNDAVFENDTNDDITATPPPPNFTRVFSETEQKHLFDGLIDGDFLHKETDFSDFCRVFRTKDYKDDGKQLKRLKWIKTSSRSKFITIKDLVRMLVLMGIPETEIKNRSLLNSIFETPNGIKANHYTDLTDKNRNLKQFKSEYHTELYNIVSKSKEK